MAGLVVVMLLRVTGLSPKLPKLKGRTAVADVEAAAPGSNRGGGSEAAAGGPTDAQRPTAADPNGAPARRWGAGRRPGPLELGLRGVVFFRPSGGGSKWGTFSRKLNEESEIAYCLRQMIDL